LPGAVHRLAPTACTLADTLLPIATQAAKQVQGVELLQKMQQLPRREQKIVVSLVLF
jgi:hypothetical protein